MTDVDVLIAGGGPVGVVAAIEARLAGMEVAVVEPREGAIDKACGEGLMPGALPELARIGVDPQGTPLAGIVYRDEIRRIEHRFESGPGRGVRRTLLHAALRARAEELGTHFVTGRVEHLEQDAAAVTAAGIRSRWLIGADGLHSTVAGLVGLARSTPRARRRFGQRQHYAVPPWSPFVEVTWTPLGELYVTPIDQDIVGVAALARRGTHYDEVVAASPSVTDRLRSAQRIGTVRGAGPFRQHTRARVAGRVLLVGDASGYVDALTGEGLRIGFAQARAAISAVRADDPSGYERAWERETRDFRRLTSTLVRLATSPVRGFVVPAAICMPRVFAGAVESLAR
jgi:flavin-dependent dehydrogenase